LSSDDDIPQVDSMEIVDVRLVENRLAITFHEHVLPFKNLEEIKDCYYRLEFIGKNPSFSNELNTLQVRLNIHQDLYLDSSNDFILFLDISDLNLNSINKIIIKEIKIQLITKKRYVYKIDEKIDLEWIFSVYNYNLTNTILFKGIRRSDTSNLDPFSKNEFKISHENTNNPLKIKKSLNNGKEKICEKRNPTKEIINVQDIDSILSANVANINDASVIISQLNDNKEAPLYQISHFKTSSTLERFFNLKLGFNKFSQLSKEELEQISWDLKDVQTKILFSLTVMFQNLTSLYSHEIESLLEQYFQRYFPQFLVSCSQSEKLLKKGVI